MNTDSQNYLTLQWTHPVYLKNADAVKTNKLFDEAGLYLITRQFTESAKEKTIYIGKTGRSFRKRLWEHNNLGCSSWTSARGIIRIRLAIVAMPKDMEYEEYDKVYLEDIESALIYQQKPKYNTDKKRSYHYKFDLHIKNLNINESLLPHEIFNRMHGDLD